MLAVVSAYDEIFRPWIGVRTMLLRLKVELVKRHWVRRAILLALKAIVYLEKIGDNLEI